jgi:hypothetical protein
LEKEMRKSIVIIPIAAALAAALSYAPPAMAAGSGSTPVTLAVNGGTLDITVPAGPVALGAVSASTSAQTITGALGSVTVTDGRSGTAGWTTTAGAVDFTGPQTINMSATGGSSYVPGDATVTGTATVTASTLSPLFPAGPVQVATGVTGINTATWNPTISVTVPADALAGTYSSTLTHSVA